MFLYLEIFCCLYLMQDSFTGYLLCVLSDECVAGHNERITHENRHTKVGKWAGNFNFM